MPLTLEVRTTPLVLVDIERLLFEIIVVVAVIPLIVEVRILSVIDCVKVEIIDLTPPDIPLTIFSNKFPVTDEMLELIIDEVEIISIYILNIRYCNYLKGY